MFLTATRPSKPTERLGSALLLASVALVTLSASACSQGATTQDVAQEVMPEVMPDVMAQEAAAGELASFIAESRRHAGEVHRAR